MGSSVRLTGDQRRSAIVRAVRTVFAEKGFAGTTTRELADAAGVSEALLFKHFPNKEALFSAMQLSCTREEDSEEQQRLRALRPSTASLVATIHSLFSSLIGRLARRDDDETIRIRLVLRDLTGDGTFARQLVARLTADWIPLVEENLRAAIDEGDVVESPVPLRLRAWFTRHLAGMIVLHLLPPTPVVDYGVSREEVIAHATRFALRGMGLTDEAIRRHFRSPSQVAI